MINQSTGIYSPDWFLHMAVDWPVRIYCKVPKFWDARNLCCNLPKIQTKRPNPKGYIFCQNGAIGIANSEDPDQTAPLGLHCLPRPICLKT